MNMDLQAFGRKLGRRSRERLAIPGAAVSWAPRGQKSFPEETSPLSDISRAGLSLLTNDPLKVGSDIALRIFLPQKSGSFDLLGKVAYCIARGPRLTYGYRIGVQFLPFAASEEGNAPESLAVIEALEQTYGHRKRK